MWLEHTSLSREAEEELRLSLARWGAWKQARAEQVDPRVYLLIMFPLSLLFLPILKS